jgi:hypothetical protein
MELSCVVSRLHRHTVNVYWHSQHQMIRGGIHVVPDLSILKLSVCLHTQTAAELVTLAQ